MYRHFAVVTVLLTMGVAMFAEGENREAQAAQVEAQEAPAQQAVAEPAKPAVALRTAQPHRRVANDRSGFDGFDASFGAPMDSAKGSWTGRATRIALPAAQAGYSDEYLASLDPEERSLLLNGLEKEGLLSPDGRARKSAALIAASEARGGGPRENSDAGAPGPTRTGTPFDKRF